MLILLRFMHNWLYLPHICPVLNFITLRNNSPALRFKIAHKSNMSVVFMVIFNNFRHPTDNSQFRDHRSAYQREQSLGGSIRLLHQR